MLVTSDLVLRWIPELQGHEHHKVANGEPKLGAHGHLAGEEQQPDVDLTEFAIEPEVPDLRVVSRPVASSITRFRERSRYGQIPCLREYGCDKLPRTDVDVDADTRQRTSSPSVKIPLRARSLATTSDQAPSLREQQASVPLTKLRGESGTGHGQATSSAEDH